MFILCLLHILRGIANDNIAVIILCFHGTSWCSHLVPGLSLSSERHCVRGWFPRPSDEEREAQLETRLAQGKWEVSAVLAVRAGCTGEHRAQGGPGAARIWGKMYLFTEEWLLVEHVTQAKLSGKPCRRGSLYERVEEMKLSLQTKIN